MWVSEYQLFDVGIEVNGKTNLLSGLKRKVDFCDRGRDQLQGVT